MPDSFVDFETRSELNAKDCGASKYAAHKSTEALMLAYETPSGVFQFVLDRQRKDQAECPKCPEALREMVEDPAVLFHAHNAAFEIYVWRSICSGRWGWPEVPLERWRCTAAKAAAANQPRALDNLCERVQAGALKDAHGKRLINLCSKPQKVYVSKFRKGEYDDCVVFGVEGKDHFYYWNEEDETHNEFQAYNRQDVLAEKAADAKLPPLSAEEQAVWLLDRRINERGIPIDVALCRGAVKVYGEEVDRYNVRMAELTGGAVTRCTQRQRIVEWVNQRANVGESLAEPAVQDWLRENDEPAEVVEALRLRLAAGGTAVSKYRKALDYVGADDRARDQMLYCGAGTGRWTGKGIQPHNFARKSTPSEPYLAAIASGDHARCEVMAAEPEGTGSILGLLKASVRGMVKAPAGRKFIISDFAGIEARVLHWLCGNERMLDVFRGGQDVYIHNAVAIFGTTLEELTTADGKIKPEHADKRQIGKIAELALGYGMGAATFVGNVHNWGIEITEDFARDVVRTWRESNTLIPKLWYGLERACKQIISQRGRRGPDGRPIIVRLHGKLGVFWHPRGYLCIRLPSGRILYYFKARIDEMEDQMVYLDGSKHDVLSAYRSTYGGKLVENVVQAISRDLLVNSMQIIDAADLDLIFHVHDESVVEVDEENTEALATVHNAMETLPDWAAGLPLVAETQESGRYTK